MTTPIGPNSSQNSPYKMAAILFGICLICLSTGICGPNASEATITPTYLNCGNISIFGSVGPPGEPGICDFTALRFSWDWGDGIVVDSWWPGSHHYRANGLYTVTVTEYCPSGETQSTSATVNITNAEDPLCDYGLMVYPSTLILRRGKISETLRVELRDADGEPVSLTDNDVSFSSSNPAIVQVDDSGVVQSTGFGPAQLTVTVEGFPLEAKSSVFAGEFRIEPAILLLATNGQPTGQLNLKVANANGSPLNLTGRTVMFHSNNVLAKVNGSGLVTALRPPQNAYEGTDVIAEIDGIWSHNLANIRVTTDPLNLNMIALQEPNIIYYIAEQIGPFNYKQIFQDFDAPRLTNIAYELEEEVCGVVPYQGDVQYLVNVPAHENDPTRPCGGNGNPVVMGTDVDNPENSCMILSPPDAPSQPYWGVIFHEMGHNFTFASRSFGEFTSVSDIDNSNVSYAEGLASVTIIYVCKMMGERAIQYQIPEDILNTLTSLCHFDTTPDLDVYVNNGAHYSTINASVIYDISLVLFNEYGSSLLPRFFSVFLPPDASFDRFTLDKSDANQATFFVAAMSAAAGADLRADFINKWSFPVDNSTFNELYPQLIRLVAQHEPVVPGAPTGVTATAGNAQAIVSFGPPLSDGAGPIISYTVKSNPGNITATGSSSPITVKGLTKGTAYTFTVTATNEFGIGLASAPSNSVTPYTETYFISGEVKTPGGTGISGVLMTLGGAGSGTTTTDSMGGYQFTGLSNGGYTVTPSKSGYTFIPTSRNVAISGVDVAGQDFTGTSGGGGACSITSPNGGENWQAGTTQTITWTYTGDPGPAVKIKLFKNGVPVTTITSSTPIGSNGSGSFNWDIPADQAKGAKYRIKIISTTNKAYKDISDGDFTIIPTSIAVISPNGGETWTKGSQQLIQWTYKGEPGDSVKIKLLRRGVVIRTITPSAPIGSNGSGSFAWDIPSELASGGGYKVKVISTSNSLYEDKSDTGFRLQ